MMGKEVAALVLIGSFLGEALDSFLQAEERPSFQALKGGVAMILEYYPENDMPYIKLAEGVSAESEEVAPGIVLDFDEHNRVTGIEIEDASKATDLSRLELKALPFVHVVLSERAPAKT